MRSFDSNPLVILAAGKSSRMGYPKGLARIDNRFWLEEQMMRAASAGLTRCVIVLGHQADEYLEKVPGLKVCSDRANLWQGLWTRVVINEHPERGQYSSLLCALRYLQEANNLQGAFVLPIDTPCPHQEVFVKLLGGDIVLAAQPSCNGKRGHPVWLAKEYFSRLMSVPLDDPQARLDAQLHKLPSTELSIITVAEGSILKNLNTPREWEEFTEADEARHRSPETKSAG